MLLFANEQFISTLYPVAWVYQSGCLWYKMHYNACIKVAAHDIKCNTMSRIRLCNREHNYIPLMYDIVPGCTGHSKRVHQLCPQTLRQALWASHTGQIECCDAAAPPRLFAIPGNSKHHKMHQQFMLTHSTELFTRLVSNTHLSGQCCDTPLWSRPCTHASQQQNGFKMHQQENYNPWIVRVLKMLNYCEPMSLQRCNLFPETFPCLLWYMWYFLTSSWQRCGHKKQRNIN